MEQLNAFLETYGLMAIFGVMLLKSIGVPIPIPADAVMLAASARAAEGKLILWQTFVAILIALVIGGIVQFLLVRGPGSKLLYRYGRYLGLTSTRLDKAASKLKRGGPLGISAAIVTPGVRSVAVPAAGLANIPSHHFALGLTLGSAMFLALHFFLGYVGGTLLAAAGQIVSPGVMIGLLVVVVLAGFVVWVVVRRRQMPGASEREVLASAIGAWHEAACPACLLLGATDRLQIHLPCSDVPDDHDGDPAHAHS